MRICMFVKNSFEYDARVTKEAQSLIEAGHDVTVVAILVPGVTPERETTPGGINVIRVSRLNLGVESINKVAALLSRRIEARHSRLTGEAIDVHRVAKHATFQPPPTATPGSEIRVTALETEPPVGGVTREHSPASDSGVRRKPLWGRVSSAILWAGVKALRLGFKAAKALLGKQGLALKTWAINRRMIRVGLEQAADVFHSHDLNTLYVGHVCKAKTPGARLVYDSHELATERNRMGTWWRRWATWNERMWIRSADALIVASRLWPAEIEKKTGFLPPVVGTVINVPPLTDVHPRDLRGEAGIPPRVPLLIYQGSIQENRGIEPAIDSIELLDGFHMVVVGYGYHRRELEALVAERGLTDRVHFFGPVPNHELVDYTAAADIGLCNIINSSLSYYTTLPNKLFEYIMAGTPVIASDSPEIGRVTKATGVGVTCDPADPHALAAAARTIIENLDDFRQHTLAARLDYNWQVEQHNLYSVYERLTT